MKKKDIAEEFISFCETIAALRDPSSGCPWDLKQTHATLRQFMIEEAYEAANEMETERSTDELCDELGDVLLQVVLNAQVASDNNAFTIKDVIRSINEKMLRRHPHVFAADGANRDEQSIKRNWERIKEEEKRSDKKQKYFAKAEKVQPASSKAYEIGKLASKIQFDWDEPEEVLNKLESEVAELRAAIEAAKDPKDDKAVEYEMADVFFTAAQMARHLGLDAETTANLGNTKFLRRFEKVETLALADGVSINEASREQLEDYWNRSK